MFQFEVQVLNFEALARQSNSVNLFWFLLIESPDHFIALAMISNYRWRSWIRYPVTTRKYQTKITNRKLQPESYLPVKRLERLRGRSEECDTHDQPKQQSPSTGVSWPTGASYWYQLLATSVCLGKFPFEPKNRRHIRDSVLLIKPRYYPVDIIEPIGRKGSKQAQNRL